MNFSAALFTRSSVKFSRNGDDAGGSTTGSSLDPDLEHVYSIGPNIWLGGMSYVYKHLVHFMGSESLPVRACRSMILNEQVAGFLGKCLPGVIKGRTIPAARFQTVLGSHYECLNDPVDFVNTARKLKFPILPIFGYELSWGFSCVAAAAVVYMGTDAQKVIDTVYETSGLLSLIPQAKGTCVKFLRNICGLHDLPPTAMQIDMLSPTGLPASGGGFANVFRCMYQNADVAVKTLKVYANSSIPIISRRFYKEAITWSSLRHPNILPLRGVLRDRARNQFAMVSDWMPNGTINDFVRGRSDVNIYKLLTDVARGLIYLHGQEIVHGDLKGDNILIDNGGNALIADFGLVVSGWANPSADEGYGSTRWMSPELLDTEVLGQATRKKASDLYALGMVVYEVLSGHVPFHLHACHIVPVKVLRGDRPERPQGPGGRWFTNEIWELLERCWKHQPGDRPSVNQAFECLHTASELWTPHSLPAVGL